MFLVFTFKGQHQFIYYFPLHNDLKRALFLKIPLNLTISVVNKYVYFRKIPTFTFDDCSLNQVAWIYINISTLENKV